MNNGQIKKSGQNKFLILDFNLQKKNYRFKLKLKFKYASNRSVQKEEENEFRPILNLIHVVRVLLQNCIKISARNYTLDSPLSPSCQGFIEIPSLPRDTYPRLGAARIASIDTFFRAGTTDPRGSLEIREDHCPLTSVTRMRQEEQGTQKAEELEKEASILFSFSFLSFSFLFSLPSSSSFRSVPAINGQR